MATKKQTESQQPEAVRAVAIEAHESVCDQPRGQFMACAIVAHGSDGGFYVHRVRWTSRGEYAKYLKAARAAGTLAAPTWVKCKATPFAVTGLIVSDDGEVAPGTGPQSQAAPQQPQNDAYEADFGGDDTPPPRKANDTRCPDMRPVYHKGKMVGYLMFPPAA